MTIYVQDPNDADPTCPHQTHLCIDCGDVIWVAPELTEEGTFTGTTNSTKRFSVRFAAIGLLLCLLFGWAAPSYAIELFVEGGVGPSLFQRTTTDGVWWQASFPHSFDLTSLAWKAGLGVQLDERWSLTASYVSLGTVKAVTEAVSDHNYDYGDRKDPRFLITAYDTYQGGQLVAAYRWTQWPVQPFVSAGFAGMLHHVTANQTTEFSGVIPMVVVGSGLCWQWVCGEVNYYRGFMAPQYPISTEAIVPMLTGRYPFY